MTTKQKAIGIVILGLLTATVLSLLGGKIYRFTDRFIAEHRPRDPYLPAVTPSGNTNFAAIPSPNITRVATASPTLIPYPTAFMIESLQHEYQTWNNCGPASLSMALSYFKYPKKQKDIAPFLKPDPNDKNVSPEEMVEYVNTQTTYKARYLYAGTTEVIKQLVANGAMVIVEKWYVPKPNDGMGHYEVVKGYDDAKGIFHLLDSYKGPRETMVYKSFDDDWRAFNRTFIVIYAPEKEKQLVPILHNYTDQNLQLRLALEQSQAEIQNKTANSFTYFNLGSTLFSMGKFQQSAEAFDKARSLLLPWRMLWYQFTIFDAYLAVGRTQDVIDLANVNLRQANNLEESYYYRGLAQDAQGKKQGATADFKQALKYNSLYEKAQLAIDTISQ